MSLMHSRTIVLLVLFSASVVALGQETPPPSASESELSSKSAEATKPNPTLDLSPGPDGKLSQEQMQALFRVVADKDLDNQKKERDYTYVDREVQNKLVCNGQTTTTETKTYDVLEIY